jgi:hypothetical protein
LEAPFVRRAGDDNVTLPPDLTQEQHFDELPFGTRGGTVVRYTFPLDAEYEIHLRLARDRNEHVERPSHPHRAAITAVSTAIFISGSRR